MMLQRARRRAWNRAYIGGRGRLRSAAAYRGLRSPFQPSRPPAHAAAERTWWDRMLDDRDLLGVKLLLLAAILGLTALLERIG
ncbi:MAG TPA: hypothetical protein VKW09_10210 [bacterium]|nr:hypothetical protein [bacterium]